MGNAWENDPLVRAVARKYGKGLEVDDARQVVRLAFWRASCDWRPGGAALATLAHLYARRELTRERLRMWAGTAVNWRVAHARRPTTVDVYLDDGAPRPDLAAPASQERAVDALRIYASDRATWGAMLLGETVRAAAAREGCSKSWVDARRQACVQSIAALDS